MKLPTTLINSGGFAENTQMKLAIGTCLPISELRIGNIIRTETLFGFVYDLLYSSEPTLIRLKTANGFQAEMMEDQPVMTDHGYVVVTELKIGDIVKTEHGPSEVVHLSAFEYNGPVVNLRIKGDEPFLAGGILMGDYDQMVLMRDAALKDGSKSVDKTIIQEYYCKRKKRTRRR